MRIADLYIRVCAEDTTDKYYSKKSQETSLRRFCIIQSVRIGKVIYEDHSAKTFRRPEWTKLMSDLRRRKRQADVILVATWDRFTTNAENAYRMSNILRKLGTQVQAVEQPLDLSVPGDRILLAFYLDAPEAENHRNSLNAFFCRQLSKKNCGPQSNTAAGFKTKT
ncbi:MAG TPA: recombinase family protein, partial [Puia sp.]|nr:recombinase family protein [Puia sp.]